MFTGAKNKLSSFFSSLFDRYSPAFITLFVLAGLYFFYFTVVVNKNEANLKERNFRGLKRVGDNISKKISSYVKENSMNFLNPQVSDSSKPEFKSFMSEQYGLKTIGKDTSIKNNPPFFIKLYDNWKFLFKGSLAEDRWSKDSLATASIEDFVTPLLRRDLFPHYYLAYNDTILLDELNNSFTSVNKYLPDRTAVDSVKSGQFIQSGQIRKIEIGGKEYRLFLLPFITVGNNKFTLGGYMPAEDYVSQQRYIPVYGILWMVIGIILIILMFPLLKVFLMHHTEQLSVRNVISSLGSIHILGSILLLVALNTYAYFAIQRSSANETLKKLANEIDTVFNNEVDIALSVLDSAELDLSNDRSKISHDSTLYKQYNHPFFRHIVWTDSNGKQKIRWTSDKFVPKKIYVGDRDYFLAVKNRTLWRRENKPPFYLTGIASRVENKNLVIISRQVWNGDTTLKPDSEKLKQIINSEKLQMISVSGSFRSMFNSILPYGAGFSIINEKGDVLFHSDSLRNLNENLVEECNNNKDLEALLHEKSRGIIGSAYSGGIYRFYVRPVNGMPYYIVTFLDMRSLWSEGLDIISACSIFTIMNLAVILIAIIIIQVAGYRRSILRHKSFLFPWLQPNRSLDKAYLAATIVYLAAIGLQIFFCLVYRGPDQLWLTGMLFSYSFCLIMYVYYRFAVLKYPAAENKSNNSYNEGTREQEAKFPFKILLSVFVVAGILFTIYLKCSGHGWFLFLASQLSLILVMLFINYALGFKNKQQKTGTVHYRTWYIASFFMFIISTAIMPSMLFYFMAYKQEWILSLKHKQLEFARQLTDQKPQTPIEGNAFNLSHKTPFYFNSFANTITKSTHDYQGEDSFRNNFENFYKIIKPSFASDYTTQMEYLKNGDSINNDHYWNYPKTNEQLLLNYKVAKTNTYIDDSTALVISSRVVGGFDWIREAIEKDWLSFLIFLASMALLITGFFFLLKYLISKVFFDGFSESKYFDRFDEHFILSSPDEENLFVNGIASVGKYQAIHKLLVKEKKISKDHIHEIDIARLSPEKLNSFFMKLDIGLAKSGKEEKEDLRVVLVRHFEMFMDDINKAGEKLKLLEGLLNRNRVRIIIFSSRSFESMAKTTSPEHKGEARDFTERWSNVMNKFYVVNYQWKEPGVGSIFKELVLLNQGLPESVELKAMLNELTELIRRWMEMTKPKEELIELVKIKEKLIELEKPIQRMNDLTKVKEELNELSKLITGMIEIASLKVELIKFCHSQISKQYGENRNSKEIQKSAVMEIGLFFKKLDEECHGIHYLLGLRNPMLDYLENHKEECFQFDFQFANRSHMLKIIHRHFENLYENCCLQIQSLASNYFLSLWQSLDRDEKITLYDIAMDEIVNPANRDIASRLARLGLLKVSKDFTGYQIMSKSFRNFISCEINKEEVNLYRTEEADNADARGSWSKFQLPVLIIVIALGIFLFTTQKDAFNNLIKYLGAVVVGIGALLKVLGMIPSSK